MKNRPFFWRGFAQGSLATYALFICSLLGVAFFAHPVHAQNTTASVVGACGTAGYTAGTSPPITQDTGGNQCLTQAGGSSATSNPPVAIQVTLTASPVQLPANALTNGAIFYILSTNTGTECIGKDNTVTTSTGYCMSTTNGVSAGSLGVNNTNLIWVIGTNTTDKLYLLGN